MCRKPQGNSLFHNVLKWPFLLSSRHHEKRAQTRMVEPKKALCPPVHGLHGTLMAVPGMTLWFLAGLSRLRQGLSGLLA